MAEGEERIGLELGMGWLPDYPHFRDYTIERSELSARLTRLQQKDSVKTMLTKVGVAEPVKVTVPTSRDLIKWCSPVEHQGALGSCTAHAGVGIMEYYERRAFDKHIDASRLFLTKQLAIFFIGPEIQEHFFALRWLLWCFLVFLQRNIGPIAYRTSTKNPRPSVTALGKTTKLCNIVDLTLQLQLRICF